MPAGCDQEQLNNSGGVGAGRAVCTAAEVAAQSGLAVAVVLALLPYQGDQRPTDAHVRAYDEQSVLRARLALLMQRHGVADKWIRHSLASATVPGLLNDIAEWEASLEVAQ